MSEMISAVGFYGYTAEAIAYLVVGVYLLATWRSDLSHVLLILSCFVTAAWAGVIAYGYQANAGFGVGEQALAHLRQGLWLSVLWVLLYPELNALNDASRPRGLLVRTALLVALWLGLGLFELRWLLVGPQTQLLLRLVLIVAGLVLIENLLRRTTVHGRWELKFLCIGLGGIFVYDLFLTAEGFLSQGIDPAFESARGVVHALAAAFIGISVRRITKPDNSLRVSPSTMFYTGTLTAGGIYLCLMALATIFVGRIAGETAPTFQAIFLFGAIAVLSTLVSSGTFRGHVRNFITDHFLKLKYDYRREWLRFTDTLSTGDPSSPVETRVVRAIAQVLDSPAGAMWLHQEGQFSLISAWHVTSESMTEAESQPLKGFLERSQAVINIPELSADASKYDNFALPPTLAQIERAWVIVPLIHNETLVGFVLIAQSRAPRDLDWEDIELLNTLGRHAASYIAEQEGGRALAEAREFEKLNRRFAFALHDMKNLVSRMSLLSSNFEKHGERAEFRKDMVTTLATATDEMRRLMSRLQGDQPTLSSADAVMIQPMLETIIASNASSASLACDANSTNLAVVAEHDRLSAVFNHLIENANQAIGEDGWVHLQLQRRDNAAIVEFVDNGCGMDEAFIERELFRPFRSTKRGGFGLGAYQCREYVRELGGDLEVVSSPGAGTTVRLSLPAADLPGDDLLFQRTRSATFTE